MSEPPRSKSTGAGEFGVDVEQSDIPDGDPVEWSPREKQHVLEEAADLPLGEEWQTYMREMARSIRKG